MSQGHHASATRGGFRRRLLGRPAPESAPRESTRLEVADGALVAGDAVRPLPADATPDEVLDHYIAFIRDMRGVAKLADLPLRDADLDALASALGGTPREIERRLIELIQCSRREARELRRVILRRQLVVPVAGMALGIGGIGSAAAMSDLTPAASTGGSSNESHPARVIELEYDAPAEAPAEDPAPPPVLEAPAPAPTNNAGEPITRSGSGDDWAEVIAPVTITPDDAPAP